MDAMPGLKDSLLELAPGVSAGFGGLRNEHLRCAAQNWGEAEESLLEGFALQYVNGLLPAWLYRVWGSVTSVPLFKTAEQDPNKVRPVGIQSSLCRVLDKEVVRANKAALAEYLEPEQLALTQGGAQKLVHSVRMMAEANPDFPVITLDMENAHNTVSRRAVIQGLEDVPSLRHMAWHTATCLASFQSLESGGEEWGEGEDGVTQGGP